MATTIPASFVQFKSNLEVTAPQATTLSTRQQSVRDVLANGLNVLDSFLTGSYARSTMISPLSEADIDVFMVLDSRFFQHYNGQNGGPAGLLDLAKRTLLKTYTRTPDISRNGQAVTIRFDDFVVDVVLGFHRTGGGYIMANSITNSWLQTDPKSHVTLMSDANKRHNGQLVPLVKMIKAWNKIHGSYFRSFHLEVMALSILNNVAITDFPSGVRYYFDKARSLVRMQNPDPAGYGDDVGRYLTNRDFAAGKFQSAYEIALRAEQWTNNALYTKSAVDEWRKLFANYFPAYG
jgi:hypothetical protein